MPAERWQSRWRTATAAMMLCKARLTIAALPFECWRGTLGGGGAPGGQSELARARLLAGHVEWAAKRLPLELKCLGQAMALSWLLRRRRVGHIVVFAVRPPAMRGSHDDLHAWVEVGGVTVLGQLPGPWVETLRLA